jgi:predicted double-glycine peptidase
MRPIAGALALGLLILAPGHAPAQDRAVRSLLEMRRELTIVQEWDLSCGAAALATLLRYQHGEERLTEREVAIGLIGRDRYLANPALIRIQNGFSLLDLKRYVDERGYTGVGLGGLELPDLEDFAPIMVPIDKAGYEHFVVYRGRMGDRVLLADPAFGTVTMPAERFERAWLDLPQLGRVGFYVGDAAGETTPAGRLSPRASEFVTLR